MKVTIETGDLSELVNELTIEEKVMLVSGQGMWRTRAIPRLGIPSLLMADGAHGVRYSPSQIDDDKQPGEDFAAFLDIVSGGQEVTLFGVGASKDAPATCFPNGSSIACSWDVDLLREMGAALAAECRALGIHILLGPGMNIRRTPLAGRSFEYYSEDPILSGDLAAAMVNGLQANGVGAVIKHFSCNNSEIERTSMNSVVDARALREIYLRGFERAIAKAQPWMVMSSYNRLNALQTAENPWLLKEVLRDEWGFDGVVISDWHGIKDRPRALLAGNDLDMPENPANVAALLASIETGELPPKVLDASCLRILALVRHCKALEPKERPSVDLDVHHKLAHRLASQSIVLLKNEGMLPLDPKRHRRIGVFGRGAVTPFIQGSSSATTTSWKLDIPLDSLVEAAGDAIDITYYGDCSDEISQESLLDAVGGSDLIIVFVDTGSGFTGEGSDRRTLELARGQDGFVERLSREHPNIVVVISSPDAIEMPWITRIPAVIATFFSGQAMGGALADILLGTVNPSGKLATSFPISKLRIPGYLTYPGEAGQHVYVEGFHVGYRWYDSREEEVLFPFGHGLSYTQFAYSDLRLENNVMKDGDTLVATFQVRNEGLCVGQEICQLYVRYGAPRLHRPAHELKVFQKIELEPGKARTVTLTLPADELRYYDPERCEWILDNDQVLIEIGSSSRDIRLQADLKTQSPVGRYRRISSDTQAGIILDIPVARRGFNRFLAEKFSIAEKDADRLLENCRASFLGLVMTLNLNFRLQIEGSEIERLVKDINMALDSEEKSDVD
jgi:beta-glucosidase